jgi:hypothetical protein
MAGRKTHMEDCRRLLGSGFEHVHAYLDKYAFKWPPPLFLEYHRKFRHHAGGVKAVKELWGDAAEDAAKIHLIRDVEIYVLKDVFWKAVTYNHLDAIYEQALKYCHDWQGPLDERWLPKNDRTY